MLHVTKSIKSCMVVNKIRGRRTGPGPEGGEKLVRLLVTKRSKVGGSGKALGEGNKEGKVRK